MGKDKNTMSNKTSKKSLEKINTNVENNESNIISEVIEQSTESEILTRSVKDILSDIEDKNKEVTKIQKEIKKLNTELEKAYKQEIKGLSKKKYKKSSSEKRKPSGFNASKEVPIEFCVEPWNLKEGELLPRPSLTKMVYDYIKDNNLKNPDDKRDIIPDENLKKLFHLKEGEELCFSNFQKHMKKLYDRDFEETDKTEKKKVKKSSSVLKNL